VTVTAAVTPIVVAVRVDGEPWTQVEDFAHSTRDDPHFVVTCSDDGSCTIAFGDGQHGRKPPVGSRISYEFGAGRSGNVTMRRSHVPATEDMGLWVAIRNSTDSISFGRYGRSEREASIDAKQRLRLVGVIVVLLALLLVCMCRG
jgi:hypothetical protein